MVRLLLSFTSQIVDHSRLFGRRGSLGRLEGRQVNRLVLLNDSEQTPALETTQRTTLLNLDSITNGRLVVLVMDMEHRATLDELAILGVLDGAVELNPPRLGRFVTCYYTDYNSGWHVRLPGGSTKLVLEAILERPLSSDCSTTRSVEPH